MEDDLACRSTWAWRLGVAGLIPFVGLALALWVARPGQWPLASAALVGYGAVILSFLGAIHWGLAMRVGRTQPVGQFVWGVVPSLGGWGAMLLGGVPGLLSTAALLWLCFAVDRAVYPRYQLQRWLPMRLGLTLVASMSCLAASVSMLRQVDEKTRMGAADMIGFGEQIRCLDGGETHSSVISLTISAAHCSRSRLSAVEEDIVTDAGVILSSAVPSFNKAATNCRSNVSGQSSTFLRSPPARIT